jgi:hypothetical protein
MPHSLLEITYCVFSERLKKVQKNALSYSLSKKPIFAPRLEDSSFLFRKSQMLRHWVNPDLKL